MRALPFFLVSTAVLGLRLDKWPRLLKTFTVLSMMIPAYLYFALGPFWIGALAMAAVHSFQRGMLLHSFGAGFVLLVFAFASLHCPFSWFQSRKLEAT